MRKKGCYHKNRPFRLLVAAALRFVQSYLNDIAPDMGVSNLQLVAFKHLRQNVLRIKIIGQYEFALVFKLSREKSRKTEGVFLVGSRRSGGKPKSPPTREFSSRFGKEETSTEEKRRRLRRLVPPWSFLTRQRFLLEKQKKMLNCSCKFVLRISFLAVSPKRPRLPL